MENEKYIIVEGENVIKTPNQPNPSDYFDILETEQEREARIYLYSDSEVKDNE
ncbi:hypothetical protein ABHA37_08240 [Clostridium tertium]|uniref:hypothetical protein n=1 Tax=Clostridium tertium TaxID=1559 RepID=UPI002330A154|nr:hypothetical protein [Clostridium tertium]MDB1930007.1 hypothetical protein [Clostridium tertium]